MATKLDHVGAPVSRVFVLAGLVALALLSTAASAAGQSARFGLRSERVSVERVGDGRFNLVLHRLHPRAVRLGDRAARSMPAARLLAGWRKRGFHADRPHALLAITTGKRRAAAYAVELRPPRVGAGGRTVRFRVREVDAASSPVPDVTRALDDGRFRRAILVIHDPQPTTSGPPCGYIGQIDLFAAASQPSAYLAADGQELEVSAYTDIYSLIGTRFGGDGRARFDLPSVAAPRGMQYRFCASGAYPPREPDGTEGRCAPGAISLQAQPFQPAGWAPAGIPAPQGLAYYSCAGRQSAGPCFVGQIGLFTSGTMPAAYTPADGRELRINSNLVLYFIFETTFGGDGKETFALPDLPGPTPGTVYGVCSAGLWPS